MDDFFKGFGPPATTAQKQARSAATAGATAPALKAPQSQGGVQCAMCDHYHKPGNQCSYLKGIEGLFDLSKAGPPTVKIAGVKRDAPGSKTAKMAVRGGGGGIPGHTGGNPHHGPDGKFTTASAAVSSTPAKGKPAVPVEKKGGGAIVASGDKKDAKKQKVFGREIDPDAPKKPRGRLADMDAGERAEAKASNKKKAGEYWAGRNAKNKEKKQRAKDNNSPHIFDDKGVSVSNPNHDPNKTVGPKPKNDAATAPTALAPKKDIESLFDDVTPSTTGAKPLDTGALGTASVGTKTGAASPKAAAKQGGPVAGSDGGSGGVKGPTSETQEGSRTAVGGKDTAAYHAAADDYKDRVDPPEKSAPLKADDYDKAHIQISQKLDGEARAAAKASGASPQQVNQAGYEAVQDSADALNMARERGIPANDVDQHMPGLMQEAKQNRIDAHQASQRVENLFDAPGTSAGSQPLDPNAFGTAGQASNTNAPTMNLADQLEPSQESASPSRAPSGGRAPNSSPQSREKKGGSLGLPVSQMYGAGSSIGGGMAGSPGGGVAPTASFAAQRTHQLLNPNLNPSRGPAMASAGSGDGGKSAWAGSTKNRHVQKSILELLDG